MQKEVPNQSREQFGTRIGMILSTIGFAVGVGNLWRFPYITGMYGGGVFILFYLLVVIFIGIPLVTAEMSLGSSTKQSPVGAYKALAPNKPWYLTGYLSMLAVILIISYTLPIYAWILNYVFVTGTGTFAGMNPTQIGDYFNAFSSNTTQVLIWAVVNIVLTILVVRKDLQNGLEKISKLLIPILYVFIIALIIRGLTLPGAIEGVKFYLTPDFTKFSWDAVFAAVGQAFFSIGVAMAAALVFGSYLKDEDKSLTSNGRIVGLADTSVALLAGFMIFPSVFAFGLEPAGGPGLTFVTMPNVFNSMAGGNLWGFIFYLCFYIAAFTSAISGWEAVIAFLKDEFNMTRSKAVITTTIMVTAIGLPCIFSMNIFGTIDLIENNIILPLGGLLMSIFVGWVWGIDNFAKEANITSNGAIKIWTFLIKYFIPIVIVALALSQFGII